MKIGDMTKCTLFSIRGIDYLSTVRIENDDRICIDLYTGRHVYIPLHADASPASVVFLAAS